MSTGRRTTPTVTRPTPASPDEAQRPSNRAATARAGITATQNARPTTDIDRKSRVTLDALTGGWRRNPTRRGLHRHRAWSTVIAAADLLAAEVHLDLALRHLESLAALVTPLAEASQLSATDRFELNGATAEAGLLIDQLARTIAGSSLEVELARLLDSAERPID